MPKKKPLTTKRGQHHKFKSFRINLVKDATLEKIDSNMLRNRPEAFEKKKVTFEKKNSDPSYFQKTLCTAFPSLHGSEFFLCRLTCTNASKDTKTTLVPLPPEINNAVALCDCEELNRSCLYIKLQSDFSSKDDEDDSSDAVCSSSPPSSPSKMITEPDLLPTNSDPFVTLSLPPPPTTHESPILKFVETTQRSDEHHIQPLASPPFLTVATSDINQPVDVPLSSSNQQPFLLLNHVRKENQLLDMNTRAEMTSSQDTGRRSYLLPPKKRKFPPGSEILTSVGSTQNDEHHIPPLASQNFEMTAYGDAIGSMDDDMDGMKELRNRIKTARLLYSIPNVEGTASFDASSRELATTSFTAFLRDNALPPETAQQSGTLDVSYSYQTSNPTYYTNQPILLDVQKSAIEAPRLQASAQQWNDVNSTYTNAPNLTWQQDNNIQTANNSQTNLSEVNVTRSEYITEEEGQINLIRRHLDFLVDRIDPDFGLLDVMIAHKDLTMAQYHQIRSMPSTVEERNQKLLNYIIDQKKADSLIAALADGRQMHLANYLISDGEYQDTYHGVWPMSENELEKLILNRQALIDGLDASYLSFNLYFKGVINKRQQEFILCKATNTQKNEVMLEILRHGSIDHYKQTIEALKDLKNDHILKILGEFEEDREQIQVIEQQLEREKNEKEQERKEKEQERKEKEQERKEKEELSRQLEVTKQQLQARRVSKRWRTKVKPESEELPEKYKSDPALVHTIKTKVKTWINGLTILDEELYVVSIDCSEVEVYNSVEFSFSRRWNLKEFIDPTYIGSCNKNKCLYIFDYKHVGESKEILRVDPNGKLIRKWSTGNDHVEGMSVTDESNVILAVSTNNEGKLNEYSPDGQLVREINLSHAGISCLWHAIKLANGHFLVSHGNAYDGLYGVCVVDADGNLKKSFNGNCGSTIKHLGWPTYLAVEGNGFVMVVDEDNDRVLLLDLELEFKRELLSRKKHQFRDHLEKILLDQKTNQLLVITFREILIFSLQSVK